MGNAQNKKQHGSLKHSMIVYTGENHIDKLPPELKREIVKFFLHDMRSLVRFSQVSKSWHSICDTDDVWKFICDVTLGLQGADFDDKLSWKQRYIMSCGGWDNTVGACKKKITDKKTLVHDGGSCSWCPCRTTTGFVKGKHYWEVTMKDIADDARNTFVGISRKSIDKHWRIGYQPTESWGFRGLDGSVYYSGKPHSYLEPFHQKDVIGVFLDMDVWPPVACFYVNGKPGRIFVLDQFPMKQGEMLYPAVTLINTGESVTIRNPLPLPANVPKYPGSTPSHSS